MLNEELKLATLLQCHGNLPVIHDTIDSIVKYCGPDALALVDGASWSDFENVELRIPKVCGFVHNVSRSPYRNMALGLKLLAETYPDSNWYCYCEYDVLFASERFKHNLKLADERGVWMLGNDGHIDEHQIPLVEALLKTKFKSYYYLLGCCLFFSKHFIQKLVEIEFFDRFLALTNSFTDGYFPGYEGYDVSEIMYPSLCRHFGGNIGVFASFDEHKKWHGAYRLFPMRWRPELDPEVDEFKGSSILHPLKEINCPIREYHRKIRGQL